MTASQILCVQGQVFNHGPWHNMPYARSDVFDRAIATFARLYSDQTHHYELFIETIKVCEINEEIKYLKVVEKLFGLSPHCFFVLILLKIYSFLFSNDFIASSAFSYRLSFPITSIKPECSNCSLKPGSTLDMAKTTFFLSKLRLISLNTWIEV
jgi:hypothetical protein